MAKRLTMAQAIKAKCMECNGLTPGMSLDPIRDCEARPGTRCECALYPYRLGKNPARAGLGRAKAKNDEINGCDAAQVGSE